MRGSVVQVEVLLWRVGFLLAPVRSRWMALAVTPRPSPVEARRIPSATSA
ncbi:hypothetical protein ACFV98_24345 [Streptomyces violascens]